MRKVSLLVLAAILAGCITGNIRSEKFGNTALAYERALRWSDFRTAFMLAGNADVLPTDPGRLQNIRVTSYDVVGSPNVNAESSKVVQLVEIRYINTSNMNERALTDQQVWEYVETEQRWKLTSPFPAFR